MANQYGSSMSSLQTTSRPLAMRKIGILGGCSDVATVEYYKRINAGINQNLGGWDIAETMIAGMNFGNVEALLRAGDWPSLTRYMTGHVDSLIAAGSDLIVCVSNSLHQAMAAIMETRSTPWIHISDPTGDAIQRAEIQRVALFGTASTMQSTHIPERLRTRHGITVVVPSAEAQADIDRVIFDELVKWDIRADSRRRFVEIAEGLAMTDGIQGVILGCTEIPLLLSQEDVPNLVTFDTTQLHCDAVVQSVLS